MLSEVELPVNGAYSGTFFKLCIGVGKLKTFARLLLMSLSPLEKIFSDLSMFARTEREGKSPQRVYRQWFKPEP